MAVIEQSGLMKYKDPDGNVYLLYPVTTKENVDGIEEFDAHLEDKNNPHGVTVAQIGAAAADHEHSTSDISGLGSLATKSSVAKSDLASAVQTSLNKADTALQSYTETDPTVPAWAKAATKPSYTKSEVGLGNVENVKQYSASNPPPYPVTSVNSKTGAVSLTASDVGAAEEDHTHSEYLTSYTETDPTVPAWAKAATKPSYTASEVGADPSGSAEAALSSAKTYADSAAAAVKKDLLNGAGTAYDTLKELGDLIDENVDAIDALEIVAAGKADAEHTHSTSDISGLGSLATKNTVAKSDLASAVQTSLSKADTALQSYTETDPTVPAWAKAATKPSYTASEVGAAEEDHTHSEYLTSYTETDPTVPAWAKAATKPSYTKSEVGLGNVENVKQYSASNPPPYPVTSVNSKTGAVSLTAADVGAAEDDHTHLYAGSSSAGGAATSADKLNTNAGSATNPVYFANGIPVKTTYTLSKSVPSDAKFTDTTYSNATTTADGLMSSEDKTNLDGSIKSLSVSGKTITYTKNDGTTGTITTQDTNTDTKVTNTLATTTKAYVTGTTSNATNTGTQVFDTGVYLDTTAGQLVATTFKGSLDGNAKTATSATSATSATKATQDASGNVITSTYETKTAASAKLAEATKYTDDQIALLLNNSSEAVDSIMELAAAMEDNADVVEALEEAIGTKAAAGHTHTVSHTPAGTVSKPSFTGSAVDSGAASASSEVASSGHTHSVTASGSVSQPTFTGTKATLSADYTPVGDVESSFTGTAATSTGPSGTTSVASSTHTHKYTPAGTVSKPTFTGSAVTSGEASGTTSVYSITGVGSVPSLSASVANRCLTLTFSAGSVPTRSSVTLPSTSHTHSVTASGSVSQPTFTGTEASTTSISGTTSVASSAHTHSVTATGSVTSTFTGTEDTISVEYTPAGTVSKPTFTGSAVTSGAPSAKTSVASSTHTHSVTASGSVSQPTFTGTAATLTTSTES